jgi:IS5 family transposase
VKQVAIPHVGKAPPEVRAQEKSRWFREGYGGRAGIEGRISFLGRQYGLERCPYRGERGMQRWVGWGILAHNLGQMGRQRAARQAS